MAKEDYGHPLAATAGEFLKASKSAGRSGIGCLGEIAKGMVKIADISFTPGFIKMRREEQHPEPKSKLKSEVKFYEALSFYRLLAIGTSLLLINPGSVENVRESPLLIIPIAYLFYTAGDFALTTLYYRGYKAQGRVD